VHGEGFTLCVHEHCLLTSLMNIAQCNLYMASLVLMFLPNLLCKLVSFLFVPLATLCSEKNGLVVLCQRRRYHFKGKELALNLI